jgi:hypothetical protein
MYEKQRNNVREAVKLTIVGCEWQKINRALQPTKRESEIFLKLNNYYFKNIHHNHFISIFQLTLSVTLHNFHSSINKNHNNYTFKIFPHQLSWLRQTHKTLYGLEISFPLPTESHGTSLPDLSILVACATTLVPVSQYELTLTPSSCHPAECLTQLAAHFVLHQQSTRTPTIQRRMHYLPQEITTEIFHELYPVSVCLTGFTNTGCFKNSFTMAFQMLPCGECYENVYTYRRTNHLSLKMLNDG